MKSIAKEDYLKTIYYLSRGSKSASTSELAQRLNIKPASVTNMVQKLALATPPLVNYEKHYGVTLTGEGRAIALAVLRRHRLIEMFLHEKLDYSWDEVHEEAEVLEHAVTPQFVERLAQALGHPRYNPHGQRIPDENLELPPMHGVPLSQLQVGETAVVHHILDHNSDLLHYVFTLGLHPNTKIHLIKTQPIDKLYHILIGNSQTPTIIGEKVASHIYIEKTDKGVPQL